MWWVANRHPNGESIELRLRQRVRSLVFDRVLRRDREERSLERVRLAVDCDLCLLHRLEQRRLRLRRCSVDLVDEQDVREDGARTETKRRRLLVVDVDAGDVRREKVRRELEAGETEVERACQGLGKHRLADARHVFDEHVTFGEQAQKRQPERLCRRVDDRRQSGNDPVGKIGGGAGLRLCWLVLCGRALHQRSARRRPISSNTATAIWCLGARRTNRSPAAEIRVTSLSWLSNPMSERPTSL